MAKTEQIRIAISFLIVVFIAIGLYSFANDTEKSFLNQQPSCVCR